MVARHSDDDDDDDDHVNPHRKGCETKDGKEGSKEERAKKIHRKKAHTPRAASHSTPSAAACTACAGAGRPRARARAPSRPERGSAGTRRSPFPAIGRVEKPVSQLRQSTTADVEGGVCSRGRLAHRWKSRSPSPAPVPQRPPRRTRTRPSAHVAGQGARGEARGKGQGKTKDWRLTSLCQRVTACASCSKM